MVILDLSIIAPNRKYAKYVPSGAISLSRPSLTPSDKKLGPAPNMATTSTDKKFGRILNGYNTLIPPKFKMLYLFLENNSYLCFDESIKQ